MTASFLKKGTAAALALATAMTFASVDNADAARRYYRGGNAAGAAFAGLATGLVIGAIVSSHHRKRHYGYYTYGPRYYGGYYAPRYYAPRYYAPRHHFGHHRMWGPARPYGWR